MYSETYFHSKRNPIYFSCIIRINTYLMRSIKRSLLAIILFLIASCSDDNNNFDDSHKIEFGFACGWCGGSGSITLIDGQIRYKREIPCGENEGTQNQSDRLSSEQWYELVSCFDHEYFMDLEYNQCNVCVDGCDEIIRITKDEITHEIRYNPGDTIPGLEDLQEKLRDYILEFQPD